MSSNSDISPVNPLPPVVVVLALAIFGVELIFQAGTLGYVGGPGAVGWRLAATQEYGFSGYLQAWMLENGRFPAQYLLRYLTYPFLHATFTHMIFVCVFLLALGKMVGEVFRWWAVLLVFFASGVMGAVVYGLVIHDKVALIGGYPAVYGLIGAFTFLLWVNLAAVGANKYRAFSLIGFLLFVQLAFGLFFGGGNDWIADLAGFATGFGLSFFVSPGGWGHMLARIRKR